MDTENKVCDVDLKREFVSLSLDSPFVQEKGGYQYDYDNYNITI